MYFGLYVKNKDLYFSVIGLIFFVNKVLLLLIIHDYSVMIFHHLPLSNDRKYRD